MRNTQTSTQTPRRRAGDYSAGACVALTPIDPVDVIPQAVPLRQTRHDPSFVTHLMAAAADHCPQTRVLRRATPHDAITAYREAGATGHRPRSGRTTRQNV